MSDSRFTDKRWVARREREFARAGGRCEICRSTSQLDTVIPAGSVTDTPWALPDGAVHVYCGPCRAARLHQNNGRRAVREEGGQAGPVQALPLGHPPRQLGYRTSNTLFARSTAIVVVFSTESSFFRRSLPDSKAHWHFDAAHEPRGVHFIIAPDSLRSPVNSAGRHLRGH
jgi:hypothetical protein